MLDPNQRYLQVAFNHDLSLALKILPKIPWSERIFIEAGTPFIKREGAGGIAALSNVWPGIVVADLKIVDGAEAEVVMAHDAGAKAVTVVGEASVETINIFLSKCKELGMISMIDMVGVREPLKTLRRLQMPPDVIVLHRGRDEERTRGKVIEYRHVKRIKSKFDVLISAAGGVDLKEARSAVFNGANIVAVNVVRPEDPWTGISIKSNIEKLSKRFLETIE